MIIKSLSLTNIRSYKEQEFYFKEGLTLLSGDIGSGKSTVLLGIEFALFGLIRGSINGSSLLRHGSKEGIIKLKFLMNKEEYVIERGLKKTSTGITQDNCSLTKNNNKELLTPVELKSRILSLLGYPEDLVTKSKTLIFRYTVYTPQEEMKQIIFESKDERLEKLRRIFGVDKYELIKNNASNYARDLRSELKNYNVLSDEKSDLKERIKNLLTEVNLLKEENDELKKKRNELSKKEDLIKEKQESIEQKTKKFNELKNNNNLFINNINSLNNNLEELEKDIKDLEENTTKKEKEIENVPVIKRSTEEILKEIKELRIKEEEFENKLMNNKNQDAVVKNKVLEIKKLIEEINHLDNCPTCKQSVSKEHKNNLVNEEENKLLSYEEKEKILRSNLEKLDSIKKKFEEKKIELEKEKEETSRNEYKLKIIEQNKKFVDEQKQKLLLLNKKKEELILRIKQQKEEHAKLKEELITYEDLEQIIKTTKKEQEELNNEIKEEDKRILRNEEATKYKEQTLKDKKTELEKKEKDLDLLGKKRTLENWISNHFINLMSIIEKQVLAKIHREFNELFKEWFSMLIDDTELEANIEQDFSPSITQNGYDSSVENLSGGEKTAVSLAYRLALNKVINDLVHDVKTKGLLILDEPTDGFSSDQLDKVRDVLERTNTKQTIIVSHEAKLESFVQNIIRISKNNHESEIIQI
ncbi:AAA family ATPase [Candidatus Woesearchaeota archaeon]|nr:AAA family ATPase [Candidatus Woesearchaeota archaeon]